MKGNKGTTIKLRMVGFMSVAVLAGTVGQKAFAEEAAPTGTGASSEHKDMGAVGAKLANPLSDLWALQFNNEVLKFSDGDLNSGDAQIGSDTIFQPVLPIPLYGEGKSEWRMIVRPVVPLIYSASTPSGDGNFSKHSGVGDIQLPALVALPASIAGKWIVGAGPVMQFPTASDKKLGSRQYGIGPAIALGYKSKNATSVLFLNYVWKVGEAGQSDYTKDLNQGTLLYAWTYSLANAWQIGFNPTISYNDQASHGNKWNVPIGIFVGKTVKFNNKPVNIKAGIEYSVISEDDFGKRAMLRIQVTPIIAGLIKNPIFGGGSK
jgi:hypothetical protein